VTAHNPESTTTQFDATSPTAQIGEAGQWVSSRIDRNRFRTVVQAREHIRTVDEPATVGGTDMGPTPYEVLLGALGSCTAITLRMYADRKGWPLEGVQVHLRSANAHQPDSVASGHAEVGPHRIARRIDLVGPLTPEQHHRLLQIADHCPVKQVLQRGVQVVDAATEAS
jgi:putative redox protein